MKSKNVFKCGFFFLLALVVSSTAYAQTAPADCPTAQLNLPPRLIDVEEEVSLVLQIVGDFKGTIEWKVSAGKIIKGQGEQIATFVAGENDGGTTIKITARLDTQAKNCFVEISENVHIVESLPEDNFESYGRINKRFSLNDMRARLDSFLLSISDNPKIVGIISIQFDAKDSRKYKINHLDKIVGHLQYRKMDLKRISFIISDSHDSEYTKLWRVSIYGKLPKSIRDIQRIEAKDYQKTRSSLFKTTKQ